MNETIDWGVFKPLGYGNYGCYGFFGETDELLAVVKHVEWLPVESGLQCPVCWNMRNQGHHDGCELALALKNAGASDPVVEGNDLISRKAVSEMLKKMLKMTELEENFWDEEKTPTDYYNAGIHVAIGKIQSIPSPMRRR